MPSRAALVSLLLALAVSGCAGQKPDAPVAVAPSTSVAPITVPPDPDPVVEDTATEGDDPGAAGTPWTPCNADDVTGEDPDHDCEDITVDACDGAYEASKDGQGVLLETLIENKDMIEAARMKDCPQFAAAWKRAQRGFAEGDQEVGKDVKPGTYMTTARLAGGRVSNCYWERSGKNGHTIANDFVTAAKEVRVTIKKSDEMFTSQGCGDWVPVS